MNRNDKDGMTKIGMNGNEITKILIIKTQSSISYFA